MKTELSQAPFFVDYDIVNYLIAFKRLYKIVLKPYFLGCE